MVILGVFSKKSSSAKKVLSFLDKLIQFHH